MATEVYLNVKGHNRPLPTGRSIASAMRQVFHQQLREVLTRLREQGERPSRVPDLSNWTKPMSVAMQPIVMPIFVRGGQESAKRIRRLYASARGRGRRRDAGTGRTGGSGLPGRLAGTGEAGGHHHAAGHALALREGWQKEKPSPEIAFDVKSPRIGEAVSRLAFDFCDATNATSTMQLDDALRQLRTDLGAGLEAGEAQADLVARVIKIFASPERAQTIGVTEASRATHQAQLMVAQDSGVVSSMEWLASADACEQICLPLNGKKVKLGEDFAVIGTGTYSRIQSAPAHPRCQCTCLEVID